ncbi:hypothetical protein BMMON2_02340 [Burkholderia mallei]
MRRKRLRRGGTNAADARAFDFVGIEAVQADVNGERLSDVRAAPTAADSEDDDLSNEMPAMHLRETHCPLPCEAGWRRAAVRAAAAPAPRHRGTEAPRLRGSEAQRLRGSEAQRLSR